MFSRKSKEFIEAEIVNETKKVILVCSQCRQKLRLPVYENRRLRVTCSRCKHEFTFDGNEYRRRQRTKMWAMYGLLLVFLAVDIVAPVYLSSRINLMCKRIQHKYDTLAKDKKSDFLSERQKLQERYIAEINKIDPTQLKLSADKHYSDIWRERLNYSSKFAVTPRERAQLEMMALSKDKTKRIEDIIKGIASKAAPRNAAINVYIGSNRYKLDIDFDMSELTSGEEGSRTKHSSVESLKHDVIRLISKVTKDVYQFCQDLDLESIAVGCKHFVQQYDEYKTYQGEVNSILYKIRIDKKDLIELKNNPFLDTYSTTKSFKIIEDGFPKVEISRKETK